VNGVSFERLELAWLLLVVAGLLPLGGWALVRRWQLWRQFAEDALARRLAPGLSGWRAGLRLGCLTLGLLLLTVALLGPRWGTVQQQVVQRDIELLVLLDVSRSMLAEDVAPSRLERAKLAIRDDLIPALAGDRVGLMTFAGRWSLECPLTTDYGFLRLALEDVTTRSAPRGGSLIGDAIRAAGEAFESPLDTRRLVLLLSDGEDHGSFLVRAAEGLWADHDVPIVVVGLGDPEAGATIPVPTADGRGTRLLEHEGEVVRTRSEFEAFEAVARLSPRHAFVPAGTRDFDLGAIYREVIAALDYEERLADEPVQQAARQHWFAAPALGLLAIAAWMSEYRRRRVRLAADEVWRDARV
jgi:Ca-activated chloride channel homolog